MRKCVMSGMLVGTNTPCLTQSGSFPPKVNKVSQSVPFHACNWIWFWAASSVLLLNIQKLT